ncbi:hypothetical protein PYCCODRAFT_1031014 [Trametes coccinea BRFM310]|uniref:DUF7918 domain-containing protein n=1 Tax=Trametes coccinea (strain BRFM310) TaxID=1353009 RepID=A0A1Y2IAD3_TRAC3|nr:hypothetical protein PYCCODRAFT_1031014 [Trametes coccinea BRFM310]
MLHRGYEMWISDSDNRRLPEYKSQIEGDDGKTAGCFIPSESGRRFVVHWKDYNKAHHVAVRMCIDGVLNVGSICKPGRSGSRFGVRTSAADKYNLFQFADLRTTDDDSVLLTSGHASPEKVGTIEVRIMRIHPHTASVPFTPSDHAGVGPVHERSKKLGAHCVTLGDGIRVGRPHGLRASRPLIRGEGPYATFVFRYRPAALLQAQGIAPPAPSRGLDYEGPSQPSGSSGRRRERRAPVKSEPGPSTNDAYARACIPTEVIEVSDRDLESVDRKPVLRVKREAGAMVKPDPDNVIDLTLDD